MSTSLSRFSGPNHCVVRVCTVLWKASQSTSPGPSIELKYVSRKERKKKDRRERALKPRTPVAPDYFFSGYSPVGGSLGLNLENKILCLHSVDKGFLSVCLARLELASGVRVRVEFISSGFRKTHCNCNQSQTNLNLFSVVRVLKKKMKDSQWYIRLLPTFSIRVGSTICWHKVKERSEIRGRYEEIEIREKETEESKGRGENGKTGNRNAWGEHERSWLYVWLWPKCKEKRGRGKSLSLCSIQVSKVKLDVKTKNKKRRKNANTQCDGREN